MTKRFDVHGYPYNSAEQLVADLADRYGSLVGRTGDDVIDQYGIGHVTMSSDGRLNDISADVKRRIADELANRPVAPSGTNWISATVSRGSARLPQCPACYAIFGDGRLLYVGSTENLADRITGHGIRELRTRNCTTPWGSFGGVVVKFRPSRKYGDWLMAEARLIRRLQPPFNKRGVRSKRGQVI